MGWLGSVTTRARASAFPDEHPIPRSIRVAASPLAGAGAGSTAGRDAPPVLIRSGGEWRPNTAYAPPHLPLAPLHLLHREGAPRVPTHQPDRHLGVLAEARGLELQLLEPAIAEHLDMSIERGAQVREGGVGVDRVPDTAVVRALEE